MSSTASVVMARSAWKDAWPVAVLLDPAEAIQWLAHVQDYHAAMPEDADQRLAWERAHPAGTDAKLASSFDLQTILLADPPALLGYANARALAHFQGRQATSVDVVREQETLWRSRSRDGDPVAVYLKT